MFIHIYFKLEGYKRTRFSKALIQFYIFKEKGKQSSIH